MDQFIIITPVESITPILALHENIDVTSTAVNKVDMGSQTARTKSMKICSVKHSCTDTSTTIHSDN